MMRSRYTTALPLLGVLLALPLWSSTLFAAQAIDKRAAIDADANIEITNTAGSIEVIGWDRSEIEVSGSMSSSGVLKFETDPKHAVVKIASPGMSWGSGDSTTLTVHAPARAHYTIAGISADISTTGVQGPQKLQSTSGGIKTQAWKEDVEIKTISGDVIVSGHKGNAVFDFNTVSGELHADGIGGEVNLTTVSGDIHLDLGTVSRSRLHTTSGDLQFSGELAKDARLDVESVSGDVKLTFRGTRNAEYDIATFSGDIRNCFGPKSSPTSKYAPGENLNFTEGAGGARVHAKTLSGDLSLCDK
jgi:Putative adhesin